MLKNKIPLLLIYSRLLFGALIIILGVFQVQHYRAITIIFIIAGLLSDIFDGIIARKLGVSTEKMRRMDSTVDQVFWICVIVSAYIMNPVFFKRNLVQIIIVVALEAVCYILSFIKFKKEVATHAIASKIWTLILFATLIQVIATGDSSILFTICFYAGIATRLEIIMILFVLKKWTNDVPTIYHAILLKKGRPIKRHKLFNG